MPRTARTFREVRVLLDTSVLFTKAAHDLVNAETVQLIRENAIHPDLKVLWYFPETVIEERAFQMRKAGASLLPSLEKVERLLGHNLGINQKTLDERVKSAIESQLSNLGIQTVRLDVAKVEWQKIIDASVRRYPPFEDGDKEKGFRDALIGEAFIQLATQSPRTPSKCRVVLVTGDSLLADFVRPRLSGYSNIQILGSLDELKGLFSTLASQVDESFVDEIQEKAATLFFSEATSKDSIYYKENIADLIRQSYSEELSKTPVGADVRESDGILIGSPRFVNKVGQRMHWITRIRFKSKAYCWVDVQPTPPPPAQLGLRAGLINTPPQGGLGLLSTLLTREKELTHTGSSVFEVRWSLTVDNKRKLSRATIEGIDFVGTTW
jgi:hypothetical protein